MWVKWDKRKDEVIIVFCFSFLVGKIAYSHEIFWGFTEESLHRGNAAFQSFPYVGCK